MEESSLKTDAGSVANSLSSSVGRQAAAFIAIAFGISWLIWIPAIRLGAHPGTGEEKIGRASCRERVFVGV